MIKTVLKLRRCRCSQLEENERGWDGFYLDSLINDHFPAYVGGPRFVNPIFYSLVNDVLSVCIGGARIIREALASVSFLKNGHRPLHFFLHREYDFQNLQVVKGQQVEEYARRLIFPISQAAVAVIESLPYI